MTEQKLREILKYGFKINITEEAVAKLYEPEYNKQPLDEHKLNQFTSFVCFDYKKFGFAFKSGEISCTGVNIYFTSDAYYSIHVTVDFDRMTRTINNYVLIVPYYTSDDWIGRKSIRQVSRKITGDADLKRYITSLHKRFDCPTKQEYEKP